MEYNGFHIRVDMANRPKVHDNKRSLFLGGLPFGKEMFNLLKIRFFILNSYKHNLQYYNVLYNSI